MIVRKFEKFTLEELKRRIITYKLLICLIKFIMAFKLQIQPTIELYFLYVVVLYYMRLYNIILYAFI